MNRMSIFIVSLSLEQNNIKTHNAETQTLSHQLSRTDEDHNSLQSDYENPIFTLSQDKSYINYGIVVPITFNELVKSKLQPQKRQTQSQTMQWINEGCKNGEFFFPNWLR